MIPAMMKPRERFFNDSTAFFIIVDSSFVSVLPDRFAVYSYIRCESRTVLFTGYRQHLKSRNGKGNENIDIDVQKHLQELQ